MSLAGAVGGLAGAAAGVAAGVPLGTASKGLGGAVGGALGGLGVAAAGAGASAVFQAASAWVAGAASWVLSEVGRAMLSSTHAGLSTTWFAERERLMMGIAGMVALPLLLVASIQALLRQSVSALLRSFLLQLPVALVLSSGAVALVRMGLSLTDSMSSIVAGGAGGDVRRVISALAVSFAQGGGASPLPQFALFAGGLLTCAAALMLWLELSVRAAAISAATLFLPLVLVASVWPAVVHWCRRLAETIAALVLSKFVIVAVLALGAGALASAVGSGARGSASYTVTAVALLLLAGFVPFSMLRLVPAIEAGAVAHLEDARRRALKAAEAPLLSSAQGATVLLERLARRSGGPGDSTVLPGVGGGEGRIPVRLRGGAGSLHGASPGESTGALRGDGQGGGPGDLPYYSVPLDEEVVETFRMAREKGVAPAEVSAAYRAGASHGEIQEALTAGVPLGEIAAKGPGGSAGSEPSGARPAGAPEHERGAGR